ncbi:hypothetical protein [Paenibacillus thiaminolyticus]|uniref:hypothetical protein n=1 Tax=Paenibacillus thiaminolyticus TaxID=49283 RepID=UPI001C71BD5F|nr:hypothetical protein [Paenibacillus thiaminolyticus]
MSNISFHVSIPPGKALELVKDNQNANLVHEEYHEMPKGTFIGTQVYESTISAPKTGQH